MLRSCYRYALYMEFCQTRGETEARSMCQRISQVFQIDSSNNDSIPRSF